MPAGGVGGCRFDGQGSGGQGGVRGLAERAEGGEAADVGHGGGQETLMFGFPPSSVAGFAHAEILEVVDLSFYLGSVAQQAHDVGILLGGPGSLEALVVYTDKNGPPAGGSGAVPQCHDGK